MLTTTYHRGMQTLAVDGQPAMQHSDELFERYEQLISSQRMSWTEHLHLSRRLGSGGQGVVYLSERRGTDNFTLPVALEDLLARPLRGRARYDEAMQRIAQIAALVAQIQQDNLLDVQNFVERNRIRIMVMEWIDGFDLSQLLTKKMLEQTRERVSNRRWEQINNVVVTAGPVQPQLKPGVAIAIVRECLAALAALHREGVVHGDLKPSNIMLKRTGNAKVVDIGSAFELTNAPIQRTCTPTYAAPEVLEGADCSPRRPGQPGIRAHRTVERPASLRRHQFVSRAARGQTHAAATSAADPAAGRGLQRVAPELLPRADRARSHAPLSGCRGG